MVNAYCDQRLTIVKASSLNRELGIFRHAFEVARRNWGIPIADNPFANITRPKGSSPRTRRLQDGERKRLDDACAQCRNPYIAPLVQFALETGMRRGEMLNMRWCDVSLERRALHIPFTKNGHARTIPLSGPALALLRALSDQRGFAAERVLPITENAAKMA
jgi:integrase